MDLTLPLALLGGLSPQQFMRRHWQKKPLLVRQAFPGMVAPIDRSSLFALAATEGVQSRLVQHDAGRWRLKSGPFARRALPPLARREWTLLVQGVDTHQQACHDLLRAFRFVPDARLDDVMVSFATDGGGVGPHFDSYDVFLLQVHGQRRWRIGRQKNLALRDDVPLKILADFTPEQEWVLEPGDMLYLPPRYAHDGVAVGECMTCSIGFRAPAQGELARELLQRLADDADGDRLYRDPDQPAASHSARMPEAMLAFAQHALHTAVNDPQACARVLGEYLTEPKPDVWFGPPEHAGSGQGVRLDRRTRMLYDDDHVFINGEGFRAGGRDARLMRVLADSRALGAADCARLGADATQLLAEWQQAGWVHAA